MYQRLGTPCTCYLPTLTPHKHSTHKHTQTRHDRLAAARPADRHDYTRIPQPSHARCVSRTSHTITYTHTNPRADRRPTRRRAVAALLCHDRLHIWGLALHQTSHRTQQTAHTVDVCTFAKSVQLSRRARGSREYTNTIILRSQSDTLLFCATCGNARFE